jgi:PAS domain S-box-containing protein
LTHSTELELRQFVEAAPFAMAMFDRDMRCLHASKRWFANFRIAQGDAAEAHACELIPQLSQRHRDSRNRCLTGISESCDGEWFQWSGGGADWIKWEMHPWYGQDGAVGGIFIFAETITEQVKLRQEVEACRQHLESMASRRDRELSSRDAEVFELLDQAPCAYLSLDSSGMVSTINGAGVDWLGYRREEVEGRFGVHRLLKSESHEFFLENLRECARTARTQTFHCEFVNRAGSVFPATVSVNGIRGVDGQIRSFRAAVLDHSERRRAEDALRDSEDLVRTVIDNSPDPIYMKDRQGRLLFVNPAAEELFRQVEARTDDLIGKTDAELLPDWKAARQIMENDRRIMDSGRREVVEETVEPPSGTRYYLSSKSPYRNAEGQVMGLVGSTRDITEHKRSENEHIQRLERQRDVLVREIHHRIKNHLQGVTGLLRERIGQYPELAEPLEDAIAQIQVIGQVYGLQSRRPDSQVTLGDLVVMVCAAHSASAPIPVECRLPEHTQLLGLPSKEAVPLALLLHELVTNALKYTRPLDAARPVAVALCTSAEAMRVEIRNGPAMLPAGFDFVAGKGTGTGLDLVRSLMPPKGARLEFRQEDDEVVAELGLTTELFGSG